MQAARERYRVPASSVPVPVGRASPGIVRADAGTPEVETSHHAASRMARDMMAWNPSRISPDAALLPELETIAARADDLARNNGVASGAERTFVDNVIGPRLTCKPNPNRIRLGKPAEWAREWSAAVEAEWETFANTVWFDAGLRLNFHDATRLVLRGMASAGEALALPLWVEDDSRWRTRIQLVDPARLSNPRRARDTVTLRGGVEINPDTGAPLAYHIQKSHPGDQWRIVGGASGEWERIPAYHGWGRARVIHLFEPERVGQSRGKPIITAVARQFKMLDHYHR